MNDSINLKEIPKVELHCHLEACFYYETAISIAKKLGLSPPASKEQFIKEWLITEPMNDLASVLAKFSNIQKLWATDEFIELLTFEACKKSFEEGTRILELRYAPTFIQSGQSKGSTMSFESIQDAIYKGVCRARKEFPMAIGLIGILQRTLPLSEAAKVNDFIIDRKEQFIAIDLADAEVGFDCVPFAPLFKKAKSAGLHITVHSGEENVPEAPQFVRNAIDHLGAERIGHGLQIIKDPETLNYVKNKNIPLELCPTSNWLTNAISSIENHPIQELMNARVLTTINSDDPGIFNLSLLSEYELLANKYNFTEKEFTHCNDIAAQHSFIPLEEKQKVWPRPITTKFHDFS